MAIVNDSQIIGNGTTDIVLNTRGKIYVKVNDRFYELNYKALASGANNTTIINNINPTEDLDLSDYVSKKYLKNTLEDFVTVRNWEDTMKTKEALENAKLEGFTESLTPITVNTMQMTVGNENLQFDFIGDLVRGTVVSGGLVIRETGLLRCPKTYIKHYTLDGPEKVKPDTDNKYYARWTIVPEGEEGIEYEDIPLDDDVDYYYIYLRVPTYMGITDEMVDNATEDIKGNKEGSWVISPNSIALDAEDGYYYLLTAIITGSGNNRSIGYLNGFTEILPGQIRAYVFSTPDGKQFLDFQREKFKLGNERNFIDWNVTEKDTLTVKGNISVTGGELSDTLKNFAKKYNGEIELWFSTFAPETQTTPTLQNWPYTEWISKAEEYGRNIDSVINSHLYDLYFDINDGSIYQFLKQKEEYKWINYLEIDPDKIEELTESLLSAYDPLYYLNTIYKKIEIIKDCVIKNPGLNSIIESITEKLQITQVDKNSISGKSATLSLEITELSSSIDNLLRNSNLDSDIIKSNVVNSHNAFNAAVTKLLEIIQEYLNWELTDIESGFVDGSLEEEYEKYAVIVNDFIAKLLILQDAIDSANKNVNANINAKFAKYGQHGSYLEEAFKQRTDIAGGLVLTSLIELGSSTKDPEDPDFYDEFVVKSGISGISKKEDDSDIAAWFGGPMVDLEQNPDTAHPILKDKNNNLYTKASDADKQLCSWRGFDDIVWYTAKTNFHHYDFVENIYYLENGIFKQTNYHSVAIVNIPNSIKIHYRSSVGIYLTGEWKFAQSIMVDDNLMYTWRPVNHIIYNRDIIFTTTPFPDNQTNFYTVTDAGIVQPWSVIWDDIQWTEYERYLELLLSDNPTQYELLHKYIPLISDNYNIRLYGWTKGESEKIVYTNYELPSVNDPLIDCYYDTEGDSYTFDILGEVSKIIKQSASSVFRMDGSGYLSNGSIRWDKNGTLEIVKAIIGRKSDIFKMEIGSNGFVVEDSSGETVVSINSEGSIINKAVIRGGVNMNLKTDESDASTFIALGQANDEPIVRINADNLDANNIPLYGPQICGALLCRKITGTWFTETSINQIVQITNAITVNRDAIISFNDTWVESYAFSQVSGGYMNAKYFLVKIQNGTKSRILITECNVTSNGSGSTTKTLLSSGGLTDSEKSISSGTTSYLEVELSGWTRSITNTGCRITASLLSTITCKYTFGAPIPGYFIGANGLNICGGSNSGLSFIEGDVTFTDGNISNDERNNSAMFIIKTPFPNDSTKWCGLSVSSANKTANPTSTGISITNSDGDLVPIYIVNGVLKTTPS